jgi:hypothetical protein
LFIVIAKRPDIGYCLLFTKNSILIHMVTWLVAEYRPGFKCSSLLLFEIFYEQLPCCVIVSLVPLHKPSPLLIFRNSIIGRQLSALICGLLFQGFQAIRELCCVQLISIFCIWCCFAHCIRDSICYVFTIYSTHYTRIYLWRKIKGIIIELFIY